MDTSRMTDPFFIVWKEVEDRQGPNDVRFEYDLSGDAYTKALRP